MKSSILVLFAAFQFIPCSSQVISCQIDKAVANEKTDRLVSEYKDLDIFSGVVLIAEKGKPVYHKAFGLADRDKNIKNTVNTKFDIGSMNKTFTKVIVLQLVEEGKIKLSSKLSNILPEFNEEQYSKITVEQLMHHEAGFGDYFMYPGYFDMPASKKDIASLLKIIKSMPMLFEPGTDYSYSNSGYILLGAIIEKVTGKTYHQNAQERIVVPLGLNDTYVTDIANVPERAIGYYKNMYGELQSNEGTLDEANPDGGFQSTAMDVMRFYRDYHEGNKLLKEKTKEKDPFFIEISTYKTTGGAIPHAGGYPGANTVIYQILRDDITIVVLANMDEPVAENLGLGILAIIRGQEPEKPALPAIQNVYQAYIKHGTDYVKNHFEELTSNFHPTDPKSLILNEIGYEFFFANKVDKAIQIFKLNLEIFPKDGNAWDSYGEALLKKGDKKASLAAYKKALKLDPYLPSAQKMVRELEK